MRVQDMLGIQFHGGNICYAWLPDPHTPLAEQKDQLGRCLVEVFYPLGFVLEVGYYDETGLADGQYPNGEFRVTLRANPSRVTVQEWRTRDIQTLYRQVREAAQLAPRLRPEPPPFQLDPPPSGPQTEFMDMPPPGTCHRCQAQSLPYAQYRRRSRRRDTSDPTVQDDPWGCLSSITLFAEDIPQFFASFKGITRRREIARARAQYFQPDDVTLVCTECEWTKVGDVPPRPTSGPA